jgi:glycosyltransferase involved in cell wall biosynthesis
MALDRCGRRIALALCRGGRRVLVVGNGGNSLRADISWVHSVHHAWPCVDSGAPLWFRAKNRVLKSWARDREMRAIPAARIVIANSERTKRDLVSHLSVRPERIHTVYLGSARDWVPADAEGRRRCRLEWSRNPDRPLVVLIGALGHDANKGVDTLLAAWRKLSTMDGWDAELVIAGAGDTSRWQTAADACGGAVRFIGFTNRVGELLNAADLLVSPVRYEAYGLAVHEALCRGVPVIVSRSAGIAERFPADLDELLLADPVDEHDLAEKLLGWRSDAGLWRRRIQGLSATLRSHSFDDMAARIVEIASRPLTAPVASAPVRG